MSKKKYVIETAFENVSVQKIMQLGLDANGRIINWTDSIEDVEELNSDYINEHFGDMQDTAYKKGLHDGESKCRYCNEYQRGFEDGKAVNDKGCEGCKLQGTDSNICDQCCNSYANQWMARDDKIEVGDEVIYNGTTKCVVVAPETNEKYASLFDCNGIHYSADHRECKKTGRRFDIEKILEAMKV